MSNDNHWFYLEGEERKGPVDIDVMRQLLQAGAIQPVTWVAREGDEQWRPAEEALGSVVNLRKVGDASGGNPPKDHLGDWRILLWAGIPLLAYFAWGLVMRHYQCEWRYPDGQFVPRILSRDVIGLIEMVEPKSLFNWNAEFGDVLVLFAGCVLAALGLCRLHTFRAGFLIQNQPVPGWTTGILWLTWVVVVVGCFIVTYFSPAWRGHILFTALPLNGVGRQTGMLLSVVVFLTIIAFAVISVLRANKELGVLRRQGATPTVSPLLAVGVGKITVILSLIVLSHCVLLTASVKPCKDPDLLMADLLAQAISKYQQQHGDQFITESTKVLPTTDAGSIYQPLGTIGITENPKPFCGTVRPNGDIEGTSEGLLIDMLTRTETTQVNPDGGCYLPVIFQGVESIIDTWNSRPFHIAVDGNGDGRVTIGDREITARIAVWADGMHRWLLDSTTQPAFVVFTTDTPQKLPAGFTRADVVESAWHLDLPGTRQRSALWGELLAAAYTGHHENDSVKLAQMSPMFTAGEMHAAFEHAHRECSKLPDEGHLIDAVLRRRPIALVMDERLACLRAWALTHACVAASTMDHAEP